MWLLSNPVSGAAGYPPTPPVELASRRNLTESIGRVEVVRVNPVFVPSQIDDLKENC